jgi:hypothetical protein
MASSGWVRGGAVMDGVHTGSCLCGEVSFQVAGDFEGFFLCHCSRCRKGTGSAHAANLFSRSAQLTWQTGESSVRSFRLAGTRHQRSFCGSCGAPLPGLHQDGALLVVPAGSLDTPVITAPSGHIFCASRAAWEDGIADAPRFEGFPGRS